MTKMTPEMVSNFVRLHRQGLSFREIGRRFDVDQRTVKARIEKATQDYEIEHWEAVSRQVDVKNLEEHHRMLMSIAMRIVDIALGEPMFTRPDDEVDQRLVRLMSVEIDGVDELIEARGAKLTPEAQTSIPDSFSTSTGSRLKERLISCLLEHEPGLEAALNSWKKGWSRFQDTRRKLSDQAKGLLEQGRLDQGISSVLAPELTESVLLSVILGHEKWMPHIENEDKDFSVLVLDTGFGRKEVCPVPSNIVCEIFEVYDRVYDQISHQVRLEPLTEAYRALRDAAGKIEEFVDIMLLRGRPGGRCLVCPRPEPRVSIP